MSHLLTLNHWRERIRALDLDGLWDELLKPGSPLAFFAAQGLHAAQPALSAFAAGDTLAKIAALAERLEGEDDRTQINADKH